MKDESNKNPEVIIGSFGAPTPKETIEDLQKMIKILSKIVPDNEDDKKLEKLKENTGTVRDTFKFFIGLNDLLINKMSKLNTEFEKFLNHDSSEIMASEDLFRLCFTLDETISWLNDTPELFESLAELIKNVACVTLDDNISYGFFLNKRRPPE